MNPIIFPLTPGMQGPEVADLQAALHVVLDRGVILQDDEGGRAELIEGLRRESPDQIYEGATQQAVVLFQEARRLEPVSGEVDEGTANALNAILRETGLLDQPAAERERAFVVGGQVLRLDGVPLQNGLVRAVHEADGGAIRLGEDTTDAEGRYTIRYEPLAGSDGVTLRVSAMVGDGRIIVTSDLLVGAKPVEIVDLMAPVTEDAAGRRRIEGRIVVEHGMPAERMKVRLFRQEFGGGKTQLDEQETLEGGVYALSYDSDGTPLTLDISAVDAAGADVPLVTSLHDRGAADRLALNLIAPQTLQPLAAEYRRLTGALTPHLGEGGIDALATAQETADRREGDQVVPGRKDLTVLNRATGWDARLIALAATAQRLATAPGEGLAPEVGLAPEALYGLFRAGLPSDPAQLAQVSPKTVFKALLKVRDAGGEAVTTEAVTAAATAAGIPDLTAEETEAAAATAASGIGALTMDDVTAATAAFTTFAQATRLGAPAPGSRSTYGELLAESGLNPEEQNLFAGIFLDGAVRAGGDDLWLKARDAGLGTGQIQGLQRQGKLAFLAGNSASMTARLQQTVADSGDLAVLVEKDLDLAGTWEAEVRTAANIAPDAIIDELPEADQQRLRDVIPAAYGGETVADGVRAYTEDMARKVRVSYPTQVVGRIVERDAADELKLGAPRAATATLLKSAVAHGFRLGETPVEAFFAAHREALDVLAPAEQAPALAAAKRVQRVYQITPGNEAMTTLMKLGFTSAADVVTIPLERFVGRYGQHFPSPKQAEWVHRKAQQVSAVTHTLFTIAKKVDRETPIYGVSASDDERAAVKSELIKRFPTMEQLFGSLDFCECEHCRSVLSPAAYLVDLLQFLDDDPEVWARFVADWDEDHASRRYADRYLNPYDALIARRPDIPHIPLTCENTHTALPYIDVVNEVLEYFVAHQRLTKDAAHDTGEATTAELLAEPQNVLAAAYEHLEAAAYPLTLPFDLWLETVRRFCDQFETPLARLLEILRPSDELLAPGQPYGRMAVFVESLGISPREYDLFTDPDPFTTDRWYDLYGYPRTRAAIGAQTNALNATLTLPDADAAQLQEGFTVAHIKAGEEALQPERMTVSAIGPKGSGGGGQTLVTLQGVWTTPPAAEDLLVVDAVAMLASAKTLSRRLGVTYKEIVAIVETGFVNPDLADMVLLAKLRLSVRDVLDYRDHRAELDEFNGLLAAARNALDPAGQNRLDQLVADKTWPIPKDLLDKAREALDAAGQARFDHLTSGERREDLNEAYAVDARLDAATAEYAAVGFKAKEWLMETLAANRLDGILVLHDENTGCDFDATTLRYAGGRAADAAAVLRINLFVRLWRKLGWTIEETDQALRAFVPDPAPGGSPFDAAHVATSPLATALLFLAHLRALDAEVSVGKQSRLKLLTLWGDMPSAGKGSLYAQLFLTRGVLRHDPVFDHPLGLYLTEDALATMAQAQTYAVGQANVEAADAIDPAVEHPKVEHHYDSRLKVQYLTVSGELTGDEREQLEALSPSPALAPLLDASQERAAAFPLVRGHLPALQGALGLTAAEIDRILRDAEKEPETEPLSLPAVSLLYRYGLLAKALGLPAGAMIDLKQLAKLDPFAALPTAPVATLAEDTPFSQTMEFVSVAKRVAESGFTVEDLAYLLRHEYDETGTPQPNPAAAQALTKALADGIRAIRAQHAIPADAGSLGEDVLRQKLGLALTPEVADRFLAMLNGSRRDEPREEAQAFFATHLQKSAPGEQPATGFLDEADFDVLIAPIQAMPAGLSPEAEQVFQKDEQARRSARLGRLATAFLPYLEQRLVRQFVVRTTITDLGLDPALGEDLLTDERLLGNPGPLAEALTAIADRGADAVYLDDAGADLAPAIIADVDTRQIPNRPATATGARIEGELDVLAPGAYRFFVALDKQGAEAELRFAHLDHIPEPFLEGVAATDNAEIGSDPAPVLELKPGIRYRFSLRATKLGDGNARLSVQGENVPKGPLSRLALTPRSAVERADRARILLAKVWQVVQALDLSEREMRYLLSHRADFDGLDLGKLPTHAGGDDAAILANAQTLFTQLLRLAEYARLKREMAGGGDALIDVFETDAADLARVSELIAALTRRDKAVVAETATALFPDPANPPNPAFTPSFKDERNLGRLWDTLRAIERFGVPVRAVFDWTRIVSPAATPQQRFMVAHDLKDAIRARFEPDGWQRTARPIFDALRRRQRDALVAHVMHQHGFARMEELYEYFLIDPGMEPVVQTSRIRLAIGSVQLFIQRILLNLEHRVPPSVIVAAEWEWMKRYRVWEANRKIFLFPENWLEPEFRDDKTDLFLELEGTLLQGDVSGDLVEDAFISYLQKLEERARLDIVAMHLEDDSDPARRTLHVIGRTFGEPRSHFYRRYRNRMWTPWEPITAEVEGDHLAPVIWRDRLYLFWVTFMAQASPPVGSGQWAAVATVSNATLLDHLGGYSNAKTVSTPTPPEKPLAERKLSEVKDSALAASEYQHVAAQLHWSSYVNGEWSTRQSGGVTAPSPIVKRWLIGFAPENVFVHVSTVPDSQPGAGVYIHLGGDFNEAFYLAGRNSPPEAKPRTAPPAFPYHSHTSPGRPTRHRGSGKLTVTVDRRITTEAGAPAKPAPEKLDILRLVGMSTLLPCNNDISPGDPADPSPAANDPEAVKAAIARGLPEISALSKPLFFQDNRHTFLIEPTVEEQTIEDWKEWIPAAPKPDRHWEPIEHFKDLPVYAAQPEIRWPNAVDRLDQVWNPPDPGWLSAARPGADWMLNSNTGLVFEDEVIGPGGLAGLTVLSAAAAGGLIAAGGAPVTVQPGGALDIERVVVAPGGGGDAILPGAPAGGFERIVDRLDRVGAGLDLAAPGGIAVIGGGGITAELADRSALLNRSAFDLRIGRSGLING